MKRRVRPECKLHWDLSVAVVAAKARATFALSRGPSQRGEPSWMMVHGRAGAEISQASTRIGVNIQFGEMHPRRGEEVVPNANI